MTKTNWNIDPTHSGIDFSVRHMVVAKVRGRFTKWTSELFIDEQDLTRSSVTVRIDAASIDTGNGQRDEHLRSADFFDVATYPELVFTSKKVERDGDDLKVTGDLRIKDVTHEVVLDVESSGTARDPWGGTRSGFSATAAIDRKAFGLTWNQVLETGGVVVGDKISIHIEVEAVKQAEATKAA